MGQPVNFTPDQFAPANTSFPTCRECGLIHPPTPGGCPMAKTSQPTNDKINNFLTIVMPLLNKQDDDGLLLEMLTKTIQAWRIKKSKAMNLK